MNWDKERRIQFRQRVTRATEDFYFDDDGIIELLDDLDEAEEMIRNMANRLRPLSYNQDCLRALTAAGEFLKSPRHWIVVKRKRDE